MSNSLSFSNVRMRIGFIWISSTCALGYFGYLINNGSPIAHLAFLFASLGAGAFVLLASLLQPATGQTKKG